MELSEISKKAIDIFNVYKNKDEFLRKVMESEPEVIAALMPHLSNSDSALMLESRRDLCNAILQKKLTDTLTETMVKLDKSTNLLAWVGIVLTIIIGVAQIIVPLSCHKEKQVAPSIASEVRPSEIPAAELRQKRETQEHPSPAPLHSRGEGNNGKGKRN